MKTVITLTLLLAASTGFAEDKPVHQASKPNIIIIMPDDSGYGNHSCFGNPVIKTPSIDALAKQSLLLTRYHSSARCSPSRAKLLSGRHEFLGGVTHTIQGRERLSLDTITLPQALKTAGYATGMFGKWHNGKEGPYRPENRGFDECWMYEKGARMKATISHNGKPQRMDGTYPTDLFFKKATEWIDVNLYRDFDESTRAACRREVYESFAHLLRDSTHGRLGKLLKSDYVFANGLLATYYGIDGVTGDEFRQIKLPAGSPRGGLLGMAAIHAMGSDGVVSSPVERGAWVLRHLLNDPPPPAPPNVPQISRLEGQILTTRERLLAHQEDAQCASCHRKIDPIGFGLENFNAAGKWRTEESYQARDGRGRAAGKRKIWTIDASGAFHKGSGFEDYHELHDLIAEREEDFALGFTEHLIEYALGRPFGFTDEELANEIVHAAQSKEFSVSEFIHALVQSSAFNTK